MGARAEALAVRVEEANKALLAAAESSTDEQWSARCADGEWAQGFAAYHAGASIGTITGMVQSMANGGSLPPIDFAAIDQMNAAFHAEHGDRTKAEALAVIRENSPAAAALVRRLSDDQLDTKGHLAAVGADITVEGLIEMLLIGHPTGHTESITKAR